VDRDEHLVEMPLIARPGPSATQPAREGLPELATSLPDRLVRDHDAALQHRPLDLAEAEREAVIQPHTATDDLAGMINQYR
jgi:hypothetical protein